uniref:Uncharacterized protein n=1 Tax=Anguilla anguilla TaxID=7936 RepID=A0A0E9U6K7_ANGAN
MPLHHCLQYPLKTVSGHITVSKYSTETDIIILWTAFNDPYITCIRDYIIYCNVTLPTIFLL